VTAAIADRVRDTTTSTGTGAIVLANSPPGGYQSFASGFPSAPVSDVMYVIADQNAGPNWEFGSGTFNGSTGLTRDAVLASSNGGSLVNFATGTKDVFVSIPAERAVLKDASGNIVGDWIPRTGNLASLEALAGTQGELASAIDTPAIVQLTGTAGGAYTFLPFDTVQSDTFSGSGAIAGTIPCTSQTVRVTLGGAMTSFTGTLQNGYLDGQTLTVQFISTPASGLTSITVNGVEIAELTGTVTGYVSVGIPGTAGPFEAKFIWSSSSTSWSLYYLGYIQTGLQSAPGAVNLPPASAVGGGASANEAVQVGFNNTVYGSQNVAVGYLNSLVGSVGNQYALGTSNTIYLAGIAVGRNNVCYGSNASPATAIGVNGKAGGGSSLSLAGGTTGVAGLNGLQAITGLSLVSGTTYLVSLASTAGIENGQLLAVQLGGPGGWVIHATVASLIANTSFRIIIAAGDQAQATLRVPAWLTNNATTFANVSSGIYGVATGRYSVVLNQGGEAVSSAAFANYGDQQSERIRLSGITTAASAVTLGADANAANSHVTPGLSNRYIPNTGQAGGVTLRIVGQDQAVGGGMVVFTRQMAFQNAAGTLSITQSPVLVGTDLATGTLSSITFTGNVSVSANATYESIDIAITGLASTTIHWLATLTMETLI
jgi:hypothetical protein